MSEAQKKTWSGHVLMFMVFSTIFTVVIGNIGKSAYANVAAVPMMQNDIKETKELAKTILSNQYMIREDQVRQDTIIDNCKEDIRDLQHHHP